MVLRIQKKGENTMLDEHKKLIMFIVVIVGAMLLHEMISTNMDVIFGGIEQLDKLHVTR